MSDSQSIRKTAGPDGSSAAPVFLMTDRDQSLPEYEAPAREHGIRMAYGLCRSQEELRRALTETDPHVVIVHRLRMDRPEIELLNRCLHIQRLGTGYDIVDLEAATARGITVSNVPDYCIDEVSTQAVMLLLALVRDALGYHRLITERGFAAYAEGRPIPAVRGMRAGIVGFGRIGRATARKLQGLGFSVAGYDPYVYDDVFEAFRVDRFLFLEELLQTCDAISLHCPLTAETDGMFGEREFGRMKRGAYFINTARGRVYDVDALDRALASGHVGGAGLDVWPNEPMDPAHPILRRPNVLASPHIAHASEFSQRDSVVKAMAEAIRAWQGQRPAYLLNPAALKRR